MPQVQSKGRSFRRRAGFRRAADGAVAVEFALVLTPFLILLAGLIEIGFMLQTSAVLQNATDEVGRLIRTGQVTNRTGGVLMDANTFIRNVCNQVTILTDCPTAVSIDVRSSTSFSTLSNVMPNPINVGPSTLNGAPMISFTPGGTSRATSVIITYDWEFTLPIMNAFGNVFGGSARRLEAVTIFRNEPF